MTTPNNTAWGSANGSGITGPYSLPFPLYEQAHATILTVEFTNSVVTEVYTNILGTDYTFTSWTPLANGQVQSPQITFTDAIPAPAAGVTYLIVFLLTPPGSQDTAITNYSDYFPMVHEQEFDLLAQATAQLNQWIGKAIKAPDYEYAGQTNQTMPSIASRAGMFAAWDQNGNLIAAATTDTFVTSYMATMLSTVNGRNVVTSGNSLWNFIGLPFTEFDDQSGPSGTINNYSPPGITMSDVGLLVLEPSGNLTLTGLISPVGFQPPLPLEFMQRVTIFNNSNYSVTLKSKNSSSSSSNQFYIGSDVTLSAGQSVDAVYTTVAISGGGWIMPGH